jgi:ribonuclease Z
MEIFILGTSAGCSTIKRAHQAILIRYNGENLLFDCGENTQIKLLQAKIKPFRIKNIFISHFHGDHFFGLPGLIFSMSLEKRKDDLHIFGPRGTEKEIKKILSLGYHSLTFRIHVTEIQPADTEIVYESKKFFISATEVDHSVPCLAYAFQEKPIRKVSKEKMQKYGLKPSPLIKKLLLGESITVSGRTIYPEDILLPEKKGVKVVISSDTRPCKRLIRFAKGANLLIHESTFSVKDTDKAIITYHSTTEDAARVAKEANVDKLIITHISKRYHDLPLFLAEATAIFPQTKIAYDLLKLVL